MNDVSKSTKSRCPHCNSHELFEKSEGLLSICLVCFKTIRAEQKLQKRKIAWPRMAIGVGVLAASMSAAAFGTAALYEWHVKYEMGRAAVHAVSVAPASLVEQDTGAGLEDRAAAYGDKPWYKGFMDRADSCQLMQENVTPKDDVEADGGDAYVVDARTDDKEYAIFYTTGQRTWVYASSENECRKAVNSWIYSHTIGGAL